MQKKIFPEHRWRCPSLTMSVQYCLVEMFHLSVAAKTESESQLKKRTRKKNVVIR